MVAQGGWTEVSVHIALNALMMDNQAFSKHCRVYLGIKTCEVVLCFVAIVRVRVYILTSLFPVT